jgi:hypothetical protein
MNERASDKEFEARLFAAELSRSMDLCTAFEPRETAAEGGRHFEKIA